MLIASSSFRLLLGADTRSFLLFRWARQSSNLSVTSSGDKGKLQPQPKRPPVTHFKIKRFPIEYHGVLPTLFNDETLWLPIYKFPFVEGCKKIIRFKFYLTLLSLGLCSQKLYQYLLIDPNVSFTYPILLFTTSLGSLLYVGNISRKLICQIYTSEDLQYLRFCRYSFFGFRRDLVLPVKLVMPLTETNTIYTRSLLDVVFIQPKEIDLDHDNMEFYDEPLKVCLRFGGVLDDIRLEQTLGKILSRKFQFV